MLQRQPGTVLFAARDALLDKVHAFAAVVDVWEDRVASLELLPGGALNHGVVSSSIDIREGFEERFRMS